MKLKSLLLGSAAAVVVSTGAFAADPGSSSFVSLDVCDAYGISGLTIASNDTCLRITGEVEYIFDAYYSDALGTWFTDSDLEWFLRFDATTQTDAGPARATIRITEGAQGGNLTTFPNGNQNAVIDLAYVQFGDTTILSAGRKGSLFQVANDSAFLNWNDDDHIFNSRSMEFGNSVGSLPITEANRAGHVITLESDLGNGFSVRGGFEDLQRGGTAALGVGYSGGGIRANAGVFVGDIFDTGIGNAVTNYYFDIGATFDNVAVLGQFIGSDLGEWVAQLNAKATFDVFTLIGAVQFDHVGDWLFGVGVDFDITDQVYAELRLHHAYDDFFGDTFTNIEGTVGFEVAENLTTEVTLGYSVWNPGPDWFYGEVGLTYAPGGRFEATGTVGVDSDGDFWVGFEAVKAF